MKSRKTVLRIPKKPDMKRLTALLLVLLPLAASATRPDTVRAVEHVWLYGVGTTNVLDTYLSPQEYSGPSIGALHRSQRQARWGKGRVSVVGLYSGHAAMLETAREQGREWDGAATGAFGWYYNWRPARGLRLAAGGLLEAELGFTYNTRNGNNPAQGRLGAALAASGVADYAFRLRRYPMAVRWQVDVPLVGAMFTPNYGQSYYEMFSLGHYDRNVRATHPLNAPSLRSLLTLNLAVGRATLSLGYLADIRQSEVSHLKRHHWSHRFVVGYVRHLQLLPAPRP